MKENCRDLSENQFNGNCIRLKSRNCKDYRVEVYQLIIISNFEDIKRKFSLY